MSWRCLPALPAPFVLAGCGPFNTLSNAAGGRAQWLAGLGWGLIVLVSVTILAMAGLVVWGAMRRRGRFEEHMPIDVDGGKRWILFGGIAVPVAVLTILFGVTLVTLRAFPGETEDPPELTLRVTAQQWWWKVDYLYEDLTQRFTTANELHIPVGVPIKVELESLDAIHSFWVPHLHGKMDAIPGHTNSVILKAETPGTLPRAVRRVLRRATRTHALPGRGRASGGVSPLGCASAPAGAGCGRAPASGVASAVARCSGTAPGSWR